jgi:3-isopropylmalate/(R)-2-methylmalate dehydratase small subunit
VIATLDRANVDTDQIIPKQFLKSVKRTGFGQNLFFDWSRTADGAPNPGFRLNEARFEGASILVARNNFGCGSSREHAVWAVVQAGYKVVIAPWREHGEGRIPAFADIFAGNAVKNGLLTVELTEAEVEEIFRQVDDAPGLEATVDLGEQLVTLHAAEERVFRFDIDPARKEYLMRGLDDIALTLELEDKIAAFEALHNPLMPAG